MPTDKSVLVLEVKNSFNIQLFPNLGCWKLNLCLN